MLFLCSLFKLQLDSSWGLPKYTRTLTEILFAMFYFETLKQYHLVVTAVERDVVGVNFSSIAWKV